MPPVRVRSRRYVPASEGGGDFLPWGSEFFNSFDDAHRDYLNDREARLYRTNAEGEAERSFVRLSPDEPLAELPSPPQFTHYYVKGGELLGREMLGVYSTLPRLPVLAEITFPVDPRATIRAFVAAYRASPVFAELRLAEENSTPASTLLRTLDRWASGEATDSDLRRANSKFRGSETYRDRFSAPVRNLIALAFREPGAPRIDWTRVVPPKEVRFRTVDTFRGRDRVPTDVRESAAVFEAYRSVLPTDRVAELYAKPENGGRIVSEPE